MAKGVTFTQSSAKRIAKNVQWGEGVRRSGRGTQKRFPKPADDVQSGGIMAVVVRTRDFESESQIITVTPVIDVGGEPQFASHRTRDMWTWFGLSAKVYAPLAQLTGETPHPTKILPAFKIDSKWRVMQVVFWNFALQQERFKVEGCLPVVTP